jgi:UDP-N-acetylmuramoyl-tripeptide--D-alanyl-D-alanine ligase
MGELGIHAGEGYERVGKAAAVAVDTLLCVGSEAGAMAEAASRAGLGDARVLPDNATAASLLSSLAREGDLVLLKASRSARMEEVLQRFN